MDLLRPPAVLSRPSACSSPFLRPQTGSGVGVILRQKSLRMILKVKRPVNLMGCVFSSVGVELSMGAGRNITVDLWPDAVDSLWSLKSFIGSDLSFSSSGLSCCTFAPPHLRPAPINKRPVRLQLAIALATETVEGTVSYFFKCVLLKGLQRWNGGT